MPLPDPRHRYQTPTAPVTLNSIHPPETRPLALVPKVPNPPGRPRRVDRPSRSIRVLLPLDLLAVSAAFALGAAATGNDVASRSLVLFAAGMILLIRREDLYLNRVRSMRTVEIAKLVRVATMGPALMWLLQSPLGAELSLPHASWTGVLSLLLVASGRLGYRTWLQCCRERGERKNEIVIVGANQDALCLVKLIEDNPELGFTVSGVTCSAADAELFTRAVPWLGVVPDAAETILQAGYDRALVVCSALSSQEVNRTVRSLLNAGIHVHVSSGLNGIDHRRVKAYPISHEPLYYIAQPSFFGRQRSIKRAVDIIGATAAIVLLSPVWMLTAVAIRLGDGGRVLFKQERVGLHGVPFMLYKFRSMVPDAEQHQMDLVALNQRAGPLFKIDNDPRVTRIGAFLRASSIDELPQLLNVLRGEMSLVGPRPAFVHEVAQFDPEHQARQLERPGITGLWQVEARDNPSFDAYRRLDLYYVENWSIALDLVILASTVEAVLIRALRMFGRHHRTQGRRESDDPHAEKCVAPNL